MDRPPLLIALNAFGDAGGVQASMLDLLRGQFEFTTVATFDTDALLDYRVHRPALKIRSGLIDEFSWPSIELAHVADADGRDALVLHGPEPDRLWRGFVEEVLDLAFRFDVSIILGLGSFPGPVPHTRPIEVATTATDPELAHAVAYLPEEIEVPSSVHGAIEHWAAAQGLEALGLWAPVPQYAANQPYPASALALFDRLEALTGFSVNAQTLIDGAEASNRRIEAALEDQPEHQRLVKALEEHVESMEQARATELPTGDELEAQLRQFLDESD